MTGSDPDHDDTLIRLSVALSTDGDFLRRSCPSCGLDFKTQASAADYADILAPQIGRMGVEFGIDLDVEHGSDTSEHLHCPYCDGEDDGQEFHTEETISYMRRLVYREIIFPKVMQMFSGLDDIDGGVLSIKFESSQTVAPARPIHGPEIPGMREVRFLCCGERAKIMEWWGNVTTCIFCGSAITIQ